MAVSLADQGYMVYAIDLYEGKVAEDAETAMQLSSSLDQDAATEKMRSAVRYLRDRGADRVASLGWCFGGAQSLQLSLAEELDATIIYYGQLETEPSALEVISGPVLGIFGENDTVVPVADVLQFKAALDSIGVESQVHIYPGVGHAFANPTGDNFASEETQDAWNKTLDFLDENLNRPRITESQRTFSITGENFRFMMDGQENPTITVNQGDTVRIEFKSNQGFHDWVLDEFDARTEQVSDGGTTVVEFVADEAGEFEYYCSVGQHRQMGMVGRFIVQ